MARSTLACLVGSVHIRSLPEHSEPSLIEATLQEKQALLLFEKVGVLELLAYSQKSGLSQNSSLY